MRLETQERQPAGTPNGGQFAAGSTGEPRAVTLGVGNDQFAAAAQGRRREAQNAALPQDLDEPSLWRDGTDQALMPTVDTQAIADSHRDAAFDEAHLALCRQVEGQTSWPAPNTAEFEALVERSSTALASDAPREIYDEKDDNHRAATVYRGFLSHLDDTDRDDAFAAMDELGAGPPLVYDSAAGASTNREEVDRHYRACADAVRPWVVKDAQRAYALQGQGQASHRR